MYERLFERIRASEPSGLVAATTVLVWLAAVVCSVYTDAESIEVPDEKDRMRDSRRPPTGWATAL